MMNMMCNFNKINSVFFHQSETPSGRPRQLARQQEVITHRQEQEVLVPQSQLEQMSKVTQQLSPGSRASQQVKSNKIKAAGSSDTLRHNKILKVKAKLSVIRLFSGGPQGSESRPSRVSWLR